MSQKQTPQLYFSVVLLYLFSSHLLGYDPNPFQTLRHLLGNLAGPAPIQSAYSGSLDFEVELRSKNPGPEDIQSLLQRFEGLGVDARLVRELEKGHLVFGLANIKEVEEVVERILPRYQLAFHIVAADQSTLGPQTHSAGFPGLTLKDDYDRRGGRQPYFSGPGIESLQPLLNASPPPEGTIARIECNRDYERPGGQSCRAMLLEAVPMLDGSHIEEAGVDFDRQMNDPYVSITMTEEGKRRFADGTAANVRRKLAIVIDDRIISAPVIMEQIAGGRAQIRLGRAERHEDMVREAQVLAVALGAKPLVGEWRLVSVREVR